MMLNTPYNAEFYTKLDDRVRTSAQHCVPLLMDLLAPKSIIDFGCGEGVWLSEFANRGISQVQGIDGNYVRPEALAIPRERFLPWDLTQPFRTDEPFDVAMSLEVAEHLPASAADTFVDSLTHAASQVIFSAAIPGQGGVQHINEQWPWYWQQRFEQRGYVCLDAIRPLIWHHDRIAPYYRQNLYLFVNPQRHPDLVERFPRVQGKHQLTLVSAHILESLTARRTIRQRLRSFFRRG